MGMGLDGFACTMPHKQDIIPFLSALSPDAAAMGSVNIVNLEEHGYIGYSTDGEGCFPPYAQSTPLSGKMSL